MNRENEIINVRVNEIIPNRFQPRLEFNPKELKELSDSIKMHGIIQPLVLRRIGDKFEIIAGERRHKAAMMAGLSTVPAIIMNIDDKQSAEVAVVENVQRKDLSAIEEAQSYKKLLDMGLTQEELAGKMGIAQPTIANKLRLLNLSKEVQQALLKNQISERHARSLLQIPDQSLQVIMLNRIITERLTVRQTDDEISKILGRPIQNTVNNITTSIPVENNQISQPMSQPTNIFDNINPTPNIDNNEIHGSNSLDMLLRKENDNTNNFNNNQANPNQNMGELIKPGMAINPFQEIDTEIMNFEIQKEEPKPQPAQTIQSKPSSLIDEFKEQNPYSYQSATSISTTPQPPKEKNISNAINVARTEVKKIKQLGFEVDTEEFDFEDMYQIIIKIKKD